MKTINNDGEIIFPGTPESEMTEAFVRIDSGKTAMPLFLTDFETAPYICNHWLSRFNQIKKSVEKSPFK